MTMLRTCAGCRAPLAEGDRYCGACGRATRDHAKRARRATQLDRSESLRAGLAIAIGFLVPTIVPLLAWFGLDLDAADDDAFAVRGTIIQAGALLLGTLGILACLGGSAWQLAFPLRAPVRAWCAAPMVAGVTWLVAVFWVGTLTRLAPPDSLPPRATSEPAIAIVYAIALAPLLEEALCRGVLWTALDRFGRGAQTVTTTAVVFALLHALNGGFFLELPHRFVAGLLFGWLRASSRSLAPAVLAHAMHNAAAIVLAP